MTAENLRLWSKANQQPERWTERQFENLGGDKGFLPEAYWPSSALAREAVREQGVGE